MNVEQHRRDELRALFPSVFTLASDGENEVIDFEKLKAELGLPTDAFENRRERTGWIGPARKTAFVSFRNRRMARYVLSESNQLSSTRPAMSSLRETILKC